MLRSAAISCLLLPACAAVAQDDDRDRQGLSGKAAFGYLATSGNTESTNVNGAFSITQQRELWRQQVDLSAVSASNEGATTAEAYRAAHEARRAFGDRAFLFTSVDYKVDRFSGYAEQVSETVGYGRRLLDLDRHALDGGIGLGWRQAELRDGLEEDDQIVRGSLNYLLTLSDTAQFEQGIVVESGSTNTSLDAVSALRARLYGAVSLVLSYRLKSNSDVPPDAVETDRFTSISIEYAF